MVLDVDLLSGTYQALTLPRYAARQRAVQFSWKNAAKIFENNLVFAKTDAKTDVITSEKTSTLTKHNRIGMPNYRAIDSGKVFDT